MIIIGAFIWLVCGYISWLTSMNDTNIAIKFVPAIVALFVALLFGPFTVPLARYFSSMIELSNESKNEIERIRKYANRRTCIEQNQ